MGTCASTRGCTKTEKKQELTRFIIPRISKLTVVMLSLALNLSI